MAAKTELRRKISNVQMSDFPDLRAYVEAMEALFFKADRMGVNLSEDDKCHLVLEGLSADLQYMRHLIMAPYDAQEGTTFLCQCTFGTRGNGGLFTTFWSTEAA